MYKIFTKCTFWMALPGGKKMKTDLLDELALKLGCSYLSDLKCAQNLQKIQALLERMGPEEFSIKEWDYVLSYLLDREVYVQTPAEAAAVLSLDKTE